MLPPVLLMHMLSSSHSESHFGWPYGTFLVRHFWTFPRHGFPCSLPSRGPTGAPLGVRGRSYLRPAAGPRPARVQLGTGKLRLLAWLGLGFGWLGFHGTKAFGWIFRFRLGFGFGLISARFWFGLIWIWA